MNVIFCEKSKPSKHKKLLQNRKHKRPKQQTTDKMTNIKYVTHTRTNNKRTKEHKEELPWMMINAKKIQTTQPQIAIALQGAAGRKGKDVSNA
jgi:hypothetical protein